MGRIRWTLFDGRMALVHMMEMVAQATSSNLFGLGMPGPTTKRSLDGNMMLPVEDFSYVDMNTLWKQKGPACLRRTCMGTELRQLGSLILFEGADKVKEVLTSARQTYSAQRKKLRSLQHLNHAMAKLSIRR